MNKKYKESFEKFIDNKTEIVATLSGMLDGMTKLNSSEILNKFTWKIDTIKGTEISRLEFTNNTEFCATGYMSTTMLYYCITMLSTYLIQDEKIMFKYFATVEGINDNVMRGMTSAIDMIFSAATSSEEGS